MQKGFLTMVGNWIGVIEKVDTWRYARIRVRLDIRTPLKKHLSLMVSPRKEDVFVLFAYKRLPDFCYKCDLIGYPFHDCEMESAEQDTLGSWLKTFLKKK